MAENKTVQKVYTTAEIVAKAKTDGCGTVYANHAQFVIVNNELFLDFFFIEPAKNNMEGFPNSSLVARIAVPTGMAKGIATGLVNSIELFERATDKKLDNQRGNLPQDVRIVWED